MLHAARSAHQFCHALSIMRLHAVEPQHVYTLDVSPPSAWAEGLGAEGQHSSSALSVK